MSDDLMRRLEGCFYTIFTPYNADYSVDYDSIEKYLTALYRQGARKFYAMAYNSRYSQLSHPEILQLNEFCIKMVKKLDPKNVAIVGDPIHCSTAESIEFSRHAREIGADLISLIMREKHFSDEQVLDHFAEVGRVSKAKILVHEMPFLSGYDGTQMHWPASLLMALPKIPEIIALKEDAKDFKVTCECLTLEPRIRVIIAGRKSKFMPFQPFGARAYLNGISILDARIGELFWKAYEAKDEATIQFILEKLEAPFFDICAVKYGWHRVNKAFLQAAGFMHRRDRMPMPHLSDEDYKLVEQIYAQIQQAWEPYAKKALA
jgi:4-hydroxy-tetrahydrodipicolinate synthase